MKALPRILPLMLLVAIGCGDGRVRLPTAPASGTVTYQGKPLGMGRIIFFHESGQAAAADLAADGTFKLAAIQGNNRVAIECVTSEPADAKPGVRNVMPIPKSLIPERYTDYRTSGLTIEVKPSENNKAEFTLTD